MLYTASAKQCDESGGSDSELENSSGKEEGIQQSDKSGKKVVEKKPKKKNNPTKSNED